MVRLLAYIRVVIDLTLAGNEVSSENLHTVAYNLAVGHLDISASTIAASEHIHRDVYQRTIVHLHCQHLIVYNIVVAVINTTSIRAFFKFTLDSVVDSLALFDIEVLDPLLSALIKFDCRIRTGLLDRAFDTPCGRTCRRVFPTEPNTASER